MMDTVDLIQGTEEWLQARLGKATASRIADVMAKTKTGWGAGRKNYMAELVAERLTGAAAERFTNAAMKWGSDAEPHARAAYEFYRDAEVVEVGFVGHPTITMAGASPDGLVGDEGLMEIKCPNTATHIDTLTGKNVEGKYVTQMQFQMACTGRIWCDWVSFDPRLPEDLRLFVKRVHADVERIAELENAVVAFLSELDDMIAALRPEAQDNTVLAAG
ncbi:hypothetical protein LCGC14_2657760 [marine sediment metagenome]|uniref:YqaJ viral recombinase domain-containing protein n=1 Tax=marine sediment metagenome TaxID=412755 RepID=A0A0F8ZT10_9ZZZZ